MILIEIQYLFWTKKVVIIYYKKFLIEEEKQVLKALVQVWFGLSAGGVLQRHWNNILILRKFTTLQIFGSLILFMEF